jgi:hypothetical protein
MAGVERRVDGDLLDPPAVLASVCENLGKYAEDVNCVCDLRATNERFSRQDGRRR